MNIVKIPLNTNVQGYFYIETLLSANVTYMAIPLFLESFIA